MVSVLAKWRCCAGRALKIWETGLAAEVPFPPRTPPGPSVADNTLRNLSLDMWALSLVG
jgi:hypothetical protein